MKKNLLLYILLIFLILMNGFFIVTHFSKPNDRDNRGDNRNPQEFMSRELKFNETQKEAYAKLFDEHRIVMADLDDDIKILKDSFFNKISSSTVTTKTVDSIASLVALNEKKRDLELFNHFKQIYNICDDSQKKNFQSIIKKAIHTDKKKGPPKRRH